ncbi:MAG: AAA family ATPase [Bacteroidetes bacterium]|jgi:carbohydrate kinase (thermoresistant glucokinase family)|nr:AAA family ATPase [Bacteroidota bacterium]
MPKVIYIMGVSGSGKTTVGQALAAATGIAFYDADDFHPPANVEKMQAGQALTDQDRAGWLAAIHQFALEQIERGRSVIIACSALKQRYRQQLSAGIEQNVRWVWLDGSYALIRERMEKRAGHFMPPALLQSQFDTLEPPENAWKIDIRQPLSEIIGYLERQLG